MKKTALIILVSLSIAGSLFCKKSSNSNTPTPSDGPVEIKASVIASNLSFPWEILWGPDNFIWMTERGGKISRLNPATGAIIPILNETEVEPHGEGGLLGMVLHPNFSNTPHVFVVYNYDNGADYKERVVRYTYNGTSLSSPVIIIDDIHGGDNHDGSRLVISPDLKLFITTGDATTPAYSQDITSRNGKVLRINLDGTIPGDNPASGNPYWSWGHRNPQGLVFVGNKLFSSEHGPGNDDEINIIEKGRNYGWPGVQGFCDQPGEQALCTSGNIKEPVTAWTPTIAPSGLDYYNHDMIPQWKNSLLLATLKNSRLYQLKLDDAHNSITSTNEYFTNDYGRMRDICISPDGKVYICTSNGSNDKVIELTRKQ